ncbi:kinesin-like protein KIF20B [Lampris incognitus]|uniref:kinesin-like protein KIF20B n=1 Tax=Lampris incognitus TaxID=2546036 RepID=UPI0024B50DBC|nr:kinesin-like protein KIF20B [Lampris incognitus]
MMDSFLNGKPERVGFVEVEDIKRDLHHDFSALISETQYDVQLDKDHLHVYLRIRPFTSTESDSGESQDCVTVEGSDTVILKAPRHSQPKPQNEKPLPQTVQKFTFTQVYGPESSQRKVFEGTVRRLVREVLEGENSLVFTYGVTNAGKTFTFLGPDNDSGLLPRSLSVIFNSIEGCVYTQNDLKPQRCRDFIRLTQDQQQEETRSKRNLLRFFKESDCQKNSFNIRSTFQEGSSISSLNSTTETESFCLDVNSSTRFSVWVSFCEIHNENIHDLLVQVPGGNQRRTVLRLSQDVKGNSFIKGVCVWTLSGCSSDLQWVHVTSSDEAYKLMKIGKKNQSFSSTKLNQQSSRSHSIFSVKILKVEDTGVPRVQTISELALCDLAGSERCSRTQNRGERLKEAGNINGSLLTLGKCIHALRLNQQSKIQHHVPFRESKLTHFLQGFFCGRGKLSMIVNISQCSSAYDETLNVLKFSALAQKVVVLNPKQVLPSVACQRYAREVSMIIDEADRRKNQWGRGHKSSLIGWQTTLEDVEENENADEEEQEEESAVENTVLEERTEEEGEEEANTAMEEDLHSESEAQLRLVLEAQIRAEVSAEFVDLFNKIEEDYNKRLAKEKEILEDKAEKRLEIFKNLVKETTRLSSADSDAAEVMTEEMIRTMTEDLQKIKRDAEAVHSCLTDSTNSAELEALHLEKQQLHDQLQETKKNLEQQQQKFSELMEICQEKDDAINKLQSAMNSTAENTTKDRVLMESIRQELLEHQQNCHCQRRGEEKEKDGGSRKRQADTMETSEGGPAMKRVILEEEIWRLQEENDRKEESLSQLRGEKEESTRLEEELRRRDEEVEELKKEKVSLERKIEGLTARNEQQCSDCMALVSSLEMEESETARLNKENKSLVNGMFQLQQTIQNHSSEVASLQNQLSEQTELANSLSANLDDTKARLKQLESQSEEKTKTITCLTQESCEEKERVGVVRAGMEELKKESQAALQRSAQKSQQIEELEKDVKRLTSLLQDKEKELLQLREELANQKEESSSQLQSWQTEKGVLAQQAESLLVQLKASEASCARGLMLEQQLADSESECTALHERLKELQQALSEQHKVLEDRMNQIEALNQELAVVKEELTLQTKEQEKKLPADQENQRFQQRKARETEEKRDIEFEVVKRELERLKEEKEQLSLQSPECTGKVLLSPLKSNMENIRWAGETESIPLKTVLRSRRRKISDTEDSVQSENKKSTVRGGTRGKKQRGGALQKIEDFLQNSPSTLSKTGNTFMGLVSGQSAEKETVSEASRAKLKRGKKKLYKIHSSSPLLTASPCLMMGEAEDKESDHMIIKRQLRSNFSRK